MDPNYFELKKGGIMNVEGKQENIVSMELRIKTEAHEIQVLSDTFVFNSEDSELTVV